MKQRGSTVTASVNNEPVTTVPNSGPLDLGSVGVYVIGTILTIALVYYGIKTLRLFKRNVATRAWTYISLSAVFFGVGLVLFLVDALFQTGLLAVGGIMQTVGGFFLFLGLRKNYLFWASKDHFA